MRILVLFVIALCISPYSFASKIQASFDYCRFYSPSQGPYIETYISINANSLYYKEVEKNKFQAKVEMILTFSKKGSENITKNYAIDSPILSDTAGNKLNFITQERILLDSGIYDLDIKLYDLQFPNEKISATQEIVIDPIGKNLTISDIQQFDSLFKADEYTRYAKGGYDFIPYSSSFYPKEVNSLGFYFEIYNSQHAIGLDESYLITYFIENFESGEVVGNYKGYSKKQGQPVTAIASSFLIKDLPSGNYSLVIEIRNNKNELLENKKMFFQRSNPSIAAYVPEEMDGTFVEKYTNQDTLLEYINMLQPISKRLEMDMVENQLQTADLEMQQQYFLNFWVERDPEDPEGAWLKYHEQVKKVNANYSTKILKGYLSDRGFRYLKYGPPNNIDKRYNEPSTYPYEVWHYYQVNGQANRRFIFWSPNSITNNFELLHSDVLGEVQNPQWRYKLTIGNSATPSNRDITQPMPNQFGSNPQLNFPDR